jgi:hypothetical protein
MTPTQGGLPRDTHQPYTPQLPAKKTGVAELATPVFLLARA